MNKYFSVYDRITGRVLRTGYIKEEDLPRVVAAGEAYVDEIINANTEYLNGGVVTTRPTNPLSLDKISVAIGEVATFSGVPAGTQFDVDGDTVIVNDGSLVLTFDTEGVYAIRIECFPYLEHNAVITCN